MEHCATAFSETASDPVVSAGDRLRWLGRSWLVHWVHRQLISITAEDDGTRELIHENGADGGYELLS